MYPADEDISKLLKEKNKTKGFNLIIDKYQKNIYWQVRRMVIDHEDTNDLVQEIFTKVWKNIAKFRGESKISTWLYRIAVNETINFLNKKKKKKTEMFDNYEHVLSSKIDKGEMFSGDEISRRLQKAILRLPEKQRLVFNMRYYDEMPYEDISHVLGTSVGGLKASYHHAVKKIEQYVFDEN